MGALDRPVSDARANPVLLTGFEPFDGQRTNASWAAVRAVAENWSDAAPLVVVRLPVSFRRARQVLRQAVAENAPQLVLCVGEAAGRTSVGLERVAVNHIDATLPDNDGSAPTGVPVIAGAPAELPSGLPLATCLAAGAATGIPVEISESAGGFVCNSTFYALMHLVERSPGTRGGFVHVPRTAEQVGPGEGAMATSDAATALLSILRAALSSAPGGA